MQRIWWEKILSSYPKSLDSCKLYFQHRYSDQWRSQIQDYLLLIEYFNENGIKIHIHWKHHQGGKKYGYKIKSDSIKIQMDYIFNTPEKSGVHALEFAFKILEWNISLRKYKTRISGFGHRVNRREKK